MRNYRALAGGLGNNLFQFAYLYAQARKGEIPDIYLQDPKYFEPYGEEIKAMLQEGVGFLPYVALHVRRGKNPALPEEPAYSENPFYVNLSETDYYDRAISMFPDKEFLVFTDDPEYCKQRFNDQTKFQIIEGQTDIEDFNMLASCEGMILANSSFSWWAAFANPNPAKKIVAPKAWYADGVERTKLPDSWIRI